MEKNDIYLIGIAGGSASGKTLFIKSLRENFREEEVCIISQDDYYRPLDEQFTDEHGFVNYDLPGSINDEQFLSDLEKLAKGETVAKKEYTFNNPNKAPETKYLCHAPVVVVEGLFIFHFEKILKLLDLKIYIDARDDIKLLRRMQRDQAERAIPLEMIMHQWHEHVHPAYMRYLLPYRDEADIIITNNSNFNKGKELVSDHIRAILERVKNKNT